MRVSPNYYPELLSSLNLIQGHQQKSLQQLATGLRVNTPSDDPIAAAMEVLNAASIADAAQYEQNIGSAQILLQTASSALSSVVTKITTAISQGIEAAGGSITPAQRTQITAAISGIRDQIIGLANTSVQGVYLFGGTVSTVPPFALNSDPTTGVTYSGNSGINTVPVGNSEAAQSNIPGDQIFGPGGGGVMQALTDMVTALQSNSISGIKAATGALQSAVTTVSLQQQFYGSTINRLSTDTTDLQTETVSLKAQQNNLVGADPAKVITDLTQAQTAQQATLQAAAKILPMSLLNYLP